MQKDPFRNRYICIINEQTNSCVPNPMTFKKGDSCKSNHVKVEMNTRVLISKQENRYKKRENNKENTRTTQQVTTKNEFGKRWDKNTEIKKKLLEEFC